MRNFTLLVFLLALQGYAGTQQKMQRDSLASKSYEYLAERLEEDGSPAAAKAYADAYLRKAKAEKNFRELAGAYKVLLHLSEGEMRSAYADSMVVAASRTPDGLGSALLTRGIVYYDQKKYQQALDAYIEAAPLIESQDDPYLNNKLRFNMAQIKYYLGFYAEAEVLFSECARYFQAERGTPYLSAIHSLGLCYTSLGKYSLAAAANELGLREAVQSGSESFVAYFTHADGINRYHMKDYAGAQALLEKSLPGIQKNRHSAAESLACLYLAKCHLAQGDSTSALPFLQQVDVAFLRDDYIRPDLREAYDHLIAYHKRRKEIEKQLYYTNRLLHADSLIEKNFRHLSKKINRHYSTQELQDSKKDLERKLAAGEKNNHLLLLALLAAAAVITYLGIRSRRRKKIFEQVMVAGGPLPDKKQQIAAPTEEIGLSDEVVVALLRSLEKFERGNKFLKKDVTIAKLASSFNSNTKYLAKVILHHRGMKYIDYINSLKISYTLNFVKENEHGWKYTTKSLAEAAGFSTTQHFTTAFLKHVGVPATYFIQKVREGRKSEEG